MVPSISISQTAPLQQLRRDSSSSLTQQLQATVSRIFGLAAKSHGPSKVPKLFRGFCCAPYNYSVDNYAGETNHFGSGASSSSSVSAYASASGWENWRRVRVKLPGSFGDQTFIKSEYSMDHTSGVPDLSFRLLDEITDGFSPDRILGIGSFGKVYMGVHRNGEKIAVKVLHDMIALDNEQFTNEYNNLKKLEHPNIVRLVGYCRENTHEYVNYEGRRVIAEEIKRMLCFEYLHNGSLDKYLFDEHHGQDWNTRYIIIKGICNGLKYLHEDLEAPMYHLDLKPANILLDENMEPKIADFGLSRLFGEEKTRTTTSSVGTFGYLPPEYIERNIISNKLDIFSLGVIVIKIMTGRSGYSKCFEMPHQQFIQLVENNWRNRLQKPTDFEEVKRCIEIALRCLEVERSSRPTIGEIVQQLSETETVIHNLFTQLPHRRGDST